LRVRPTRVSKNERRTGLGPTVASLSREKEGSDFGAFLNTLGFRIYGILTPLILPGWFAAGVTVFFKKHCPPSQVPSLTGFSNSTLILADSRISVCRGKTRKISVGGFDGAWSINIVFP
jgi:hypothetical protein